MLGAHPRAAVFAAGTSYYGVADLVAMAQDTHDFESRYLDGLVGPLPEARAVYDERSPLSHVDRLTARCCCCRGSTTRSFRPRRPSSSSQRSRRGVSRTPTCRSRARPTASGRRPPVVAALQAELSFYGQVLGFDPPGVAGRPDTPGQVPVTFRPV